MKIKLCFILFVMSVLQCVAGEVKCDSKKAYVFLDVRSLEEACEAHLDSTLANQSVLVPFDDKFEDKVDSLSIYKEKDIIIFCRTGRRAGFAKDILEKAGFKNVENLRTLQFAKMFSSELRARRLKQDEIAKKECTPRMQAAGIKDDVFLLIDNADVARLNGIFDKINKNPDDFGQFVSPIVAYLYRSSHMNSYYLNHLHPFFGDVKAEKLPENLKKAYADFKIQQKKSMEMHALLVNLTVFASTKVEMRGFIGK